MVPDSWFLVFRALPAGGLAEMVARTTQQLQSRARRLRLRRHGQLHDELARKAHVLQHGGKLGVVHVALAQRLGAFTADG